MHCLSFPYFSIPFTKIKRSIGTCKFTFYGLNSRLKCSNGNHKHGICGETWPQNHCTQPLGTARLHTPRVSMKLYQIHICGAPIGLTILYVIPRTRWTGEINDASACITFITVIFEIAFTSKAISSLPYSV